MMKQKTGSRGKSSERIVKDIRRATRKRRSPEEKIRIMLDGLRGQECGFSWWAHNYRQQIWSEQAFS